MNQVQIIGFFHQNVVACEFHLNKKKRIRSYTIICLFMVVTAVKVSNVFTKYLSFLFLHELYQLQFYQL